MAVAHGSCLCKGVAYAVELPFERFMYCHCSRCRKATGAAHAANGFVRSAAFRWLKGAELLKRYDLPEAQRFGLQFCTQCGSKLPHPTRDGKLMVIPAGSLDDDPGSRPQAVIYWASRAPWFTDCSEMTKFDERPG
jgi:hypothetical protein